MLRVLLTGAQGVIGTSLDGRLPAFQVTRVDQADGDLALAASWQHLLVDIDAVVLLAWNQTVTPDNRVAAANFAMAEHVFTQARAQGVSRVIYASSVHADGFYTLAPGERLEVHLGGQPTGAYGAAKLYGEALGRLAAAQGLDVVCLRLGGVNPNNTLPRDVHEQAVWLRHEDLETVLSRLLAEPVVPGAYKVAYAVSPSALSRHDERVHQTKVRRRTAIEA